MSTTSRGQLTAGAEEPERRPDDQLAAIGESAIGMITALDDHRRHLAGSNPALNSLLIEMERQAAHRMMEVQEWLSTGSASGRSSWPLPSWSVCQSEQRIDPLTAETVTPSPRPEKRHGGFTFWLDRLSARWKRRRSDTGQPDAAQTVGEFENESRSNE